MSNEKDKRIGFNFERIIKVVKFQRVIREWLEARISKVPLQRSYICICR